MTKRGRRPLAETVRKKQVRKICGRREKENNTWFAIGMMGLVGWSLSVPTVLGALLGLWLDETVNGPVSWTLALILLGLLAGIWSSWYWINREGSSLFKEHDELCEENDRKDEESER